jgi:hypothetical protein
LVNVVGVKAREKYTDREKDTGRKIMGRSENSRIIVFLIVLGLTILVWLLRGLGLLTFLPGAVLWLLIIASFVLTVVNGLLETR